MKWEEKERLMKEAKKYAADDLDLFIAETGWEDWMNEYTDAEDGEPISDEEGKKIDKILISIFEKAHEEEE